MPRQGVVTCPPITAPVNHRSPEAGCTSHRHELEPVRARAARNVQPRGLRTRLRLIGVREAQRALLKLHRLCISGH
eukprot:scaffold1885_cov402-Prasinococcus_capsulatus_cf.AAC.4